MKKPFRIAVDFDGTCVRHEYPEVGGDVPFAVFWLKKWQIAGAELYLWTMRANSEASGPVLDDAILWFVKQGIELAGANVNPSQTSWTASPKLYAHVYVDDAAACAPLLRPLDGKRAYLDWNIVGPAVMEQIKAHYGQLTP